MVFVFIVVLFVILFSILNYYLGFIAAICIIALIILFGIFFFPSLENDEFIPAVEKCKDADTLEDSIITYVTGADRRQSIVRKCKKGDKLLLIREPDNPVDKNAIKICNLSEKQLGYLSRYTASKVAPLLDCGKSVHARIREMKPPENGIRECLIEFTIDGIKWDENRNPFRI